jgi:short-subunit dehydrogenase
MFAPLNPAVRDWHGQRVWLIGASSGIGAALAQKLLLLGARVTVSARREAALKETVHDYPNALVLPFDASVADDWSPAWQKLRSQWDGVDLVLFCAADYQPQRSWETSGDDAARAIAVNLTAVYRGLELVLPALIAQGSGGVGVIASVAGFLGLPQATVYGPTKAALINLAEILYADLHPKGLAVYLINPGFVATRLTEKNAFTMPALQTPQSAADAIVHGIEAGRFEIHFPRRFTFFLKCLRLLPYRLQLAITQKLVRGA